ncbi:MULTISPECIES: hypothetical protein [unclassified Mycobacterium]|uniref:hypothetical protein n=1 Tax=unclassified Mycobacterium TaxID=2642494 RepID=UPI0012E912C5|nr:MULTISPECIES: hypothetical protein [unclassified Mycobacterium]
MSSPPESKLRLASGPDLNRSTASRFDISFPANSKPLFATAAPRGVPSVAAVVGKLCPIVPIAKLTAP